MLTRTYYVILFLDYQDYSVNDTIQYFDLTIFGNLIQKELLMCHDVHYLFLVWIEYWVQPPHIDAIYINKLFFHV